MKKLLSILSTVAITGTAASTVVSCTVPTTNIDVTFTDSKNSTFTYDASTKKYTITKGDLDGQTGSVYTAQELDAAMDGNMAMLNQQMPVAMSFDQMNQALLSLVSFNQSLVVKTQKDLVQLKNFRDTFLGRDSDSVNTNKGMDTASVDGIRFNKIDDNNYYSQFQKTHISSLTGLLDLYNYANSDNGAKILGASASADVKIASDLFSDKNSDARKLMNEFANSKKNPAFTKIKYDLPLTIYNSQSQVLDTFASDRNQGEGSLKASSPVNSFYANNTGVDMETTKDGNKPSSRITDHSQTNPYAAIVISPTEADGKTPIKNNLQINKGLTEIKEATRDKADAKTVLAENFQDGTKSENNDVYYYVSKDGKNSTLGQNLFGEYVVNKVAPFDVTYTYNTDMDSSDNTAKKDSTNYTIKFTLNNLAEVFTPYITSLQGTNLASATKNGDNVTLKFNKSVKDLKGIDDLKIDGKSFTNPDYDKDGNIVVKASDIEGKALTFSSKSTDDSNRKSPLLTYNIGDFSNGKTITYSTNQLVYIFRGYKFLNMDNLNEDEKVGNKFVEAQSSGLPTRSDDISAEVNHNLRDMDASGWEIKIN